MILPKYSMGIGDRFARAFGGLFGKADDGKKVEGDTGLGTVGQYRRRVVNPNALVHVIERCLGA